MAHTHSLTKFMVLEGYKEIYENGELKAVTIENPNYEAKIENSSAYNPLEDTKELYTELNKVLIHQPKSVLKFIETYGLPMGRQIDAGNPDFKAIYEMKTYGFAERLERFKTIMSLWEAVQLNNTKVLEDYSKDFEHEARWAQMFSLQAFDDIDEIDQQDLKEESAVAVPEYTLWLEVKDMNLIDRANALITALLNNESVGQSKTAFLDVPCNKNGKVVNKKKIVEAAYFEDLFEVAFFQLRQAIFNEMDVKTCEHCGFPFEVTHERQRFCPPLFGRKRSTCENTYNQRIKRQRQKEKQ
jgi:hypothetical protein